MENVYSWLPDFLRIDTTVLSPVLLTLEAQADISQLILAGILTKSQYPRKLSDRIFPGCCKCMFSHCGTSRRIDTTVLPTIRVLVPDAVDLADLVDQNRSTCI